MQSTPFSLKIILKGLEKKRELENKQRDIDNYTLAIYILSGLAGKLPDKPYSMVYGGKNNDNNNVESNEYEKKKMKFSNIMIKINNNFNRKEG